MTTVVRWRPLQNMMKMRDEFDRLFEEVMDAPTLRRSGPTNWGLLLDISENDHGFTVQASVPGVNPEDMDITLTDNVLTIKGEVKSDREVNEEQYHLRERRYGSFSRSVTLPVPVKAEEIEATYEHGVLTLSIPKAEEVKPRKITVKAAGNGRTLIEG